VTAGQSISAADVGGGLLRFVPAAEGNGEGYGSFTFQVQDDGGTADGGVDLDQSANSFTIDVTAVNDAPVNGVPGTQAGTEDAALVLSVANLNAISVADPDSTLTVTLGVTRGTLTLATVAGLGSVTGDGTSQVIVSGSSEAITAALDGLTYRGDLDYNGTDTLTILTDDGELSDSDLVTIDLAPDDHIDGDSGDNVLNGTSGIDTINGRGGNDTIDGGAGGDTMSGGLGNDNYIVDDTGDVVTELDGEGIDEVHTGIGSKAPPDRLVYVLPAFVENLTGTATGNQGVRDNALDNVITMGGGHDLIVADAGGADTVHGGGGNDFIYYGDTLTAADVTNGGAGVDTIALLGNYAGGITFTSANLVGVERMALYSALFLPGTGPNNYIITMSDANVAASTEFFVTAASLQSDESLVFDGSAETNGRFTIHGGGGADIISGGAGGDFLIGNAGDDRLFGLNGIDFLTGGLGADELRGGAGGDFFRYLGTAQSTTGSIDRILDFRHVDRIDLSAIDANSGTGANDAFTFIGNAAFSNVAGQLRAYQSGANWFVEGDIDGDGTADLIIQVTLLDPAPLGAGDFIL
jgi:Ca2+-binding RTX toxin-like protein